MASDLDPVDIAVTAHVAYMAASRLKTAAVQLLNDDQSQEMTCRIKALRAEGRDV